MRNEEECVCSVCLFRCNILIGVRIIKEMPGSVASGTPCIYVGRNNTKKTQNTQNRKQNIQTKKKTKMKTNKLKT